MKSLILLLLVWLLSGCILNPAVRYLITNKEAFLEERLEGAQVKIFRYPDKKQVIYIIGPEGVAYYFNGDSLISVGPRRNSKLFTYRK